MTLADPSLIRQAPQAEERREATPEDRTFVATASYSLPSFTTLGTLAAAAQIPPVLMALRTEGYAAAGDGGGAVYVWQLAVPSVSSLLYVADASSRGGFWVPSENEVVPEMAGAFGVGSGTPGSDHTAAFAALLAYLSARGGGRLRVPPRRYRLDGNVTIPTNVRVVGPGTGGHGRDAPSVFGYSAHPAVLLASSASITMRRRTVMRGVTIHRQGITTPTNPREAMDQALAMAGTAIRVGDGTSGNRANDVLLEDLFLLGFDRGVHINNAPRPVLRRVRGDCINFIYAQAVGDVARFIDVAQWVHLVAQAPGVSASYINISSWASGTGGAIRIGLASPLPHGATNDPFIISSATGDGGETIRGRYLVTKVDDSTYELQGTTYDGGLTYTGGQIGFSSSARDGAALTIDDVDACDIAGLSVKGSRVGIAINSANPNIYGLDFEGVATGESGFIDPTCIGLDLQSAATRVKVVASAIKNTGTAIKVDTASGQAHSFTGLFVTESRYRTIDMVRGLALVTACTFQNTAETGPFYLGASMIGLRLANTSRQGVPLAWASTSALNKFGDAWSRDASGKSDGGGIADAFTFDRTDQNDARGYRETFGTDTNGVFRFYRRTNTLGAGVDFYDDTGAAKHRVRIDDADFDLQSLISAVWTSRLLLTDTTTRFGATVPVFLTLPGPYANDAAAAAAGVAVGEAYRVTGGTVAWRVS